MTSSVVIGSLTGAVVGAFVTASGNIALSVANWRREDRKDTGAVRRATYVNALTYAQRVHTMVSRVRDATESYNRRWFDAGHPDQITAALRITASRETLEAWEKMIDAEDFFRYIVNEDFPGGPDCGDVPPKGYEPLGSLEHTLTAFFAAVEQDLNE